MSFADRLKEARLSAGMTQQQLANKINVGNTAISNYENGTSFHNIDVLYLIFDALNVSPNFLFQDSIPIHEHSLTLNKHEKELIYNYRTLNPEGQKKVTDYTEDLVSSQKYTNTENNKPKRSAQEIIDEYNALMRKSAQIAASGHGVQLKTDNSNKNTEE